MYICTCSCLKIYIYTRRHLVSQPSLKVNIAVNKDTAGTNENCTYGNTRNPIILLKKITTVLTVIYMLATQDEEAAIYYGC